MRLSDFDYNVPEELIAKYPVSKRDHSRLMVIDRKKQTITHKRFYNIIDYLNPGDLLVINETKVYPARLWAVKDRTEAKVEVFLLRELENSLWEVMVKPARKVRIGNKLTIAKGVQCDVIDNTVSGGRVVRFNNIPKETLYKLIDEVGLSPLPPYIDREPTEDDKETYQTVYAKKRGAVAAPTAGLHFTEELMQKIKDKGVKIFPIVLHIGLGTFRPVTVEDLSRHRMDSEYFEVSAETALAINNARSKSKRIIAVGTSVVRTLETVTVSGFQITPRRGWTDKFIHPPYEFKMVDALITNFHQPKSTTIMQVSAFGGHELIMRAYQEAIEKKYRFFSYGDSMLII
ncbi:MAG TPA: tRNA preQ1(34) S-adenosylmethionine ribosyltransferase-isomerase QueA [Candidatus Marinimicrobia bacterium]|jgi:S-adenosylmethionine:tRNA ribosyltransferase-isomerase|nr:tRNA preQ1(34) S-adenosylmethionine ribosyltransferase-isomerase QueA [Candidatus Neomarinimicrobiota bacterium]HOU17073.1 tRNA preQ1(34) S-adenosylmethionine ribosyltransferase-isomerase QueA [Candidatus Neomarinimicrobiota bacterium]HQC63144.1 tRNA preQ1(34) S-adenosylmethionine ribosyltransferase-isomerase QueA [Candidatus Neomarinimicrobiota bacterium]HQE95328.1 tRNA preQ1(34) S-adenosylmethionine ribosyltransferase-isomerase QueA [Candidatus Neomarinimicrobiota bacterium]HQH56339.1 tRNA